MAKTEEKTAPATTVNRGQLAAAMGVALTTLDGWVRDGCPVVQRGAGRGKEWKFSLPDVVAWVRARDVEQATGKTQADEAQLRRRRALADTRKAELDLAKAQALVADLAQVERMVGRAFAEVRAGLRNIPGRVVSRLIGETDERKFKAVLLEEIDLTLEALANADLAGSDEDDQDEDADE